MLKKLLASTLAISLLVAPVVAQAKACRDTDSGRYVKCTKPAPVRCRDGQTGRFVKCSKARPARCRDSKGRFTSCTATNVQSSTLTLNRAAAEGSQAAGAQVPAIAAPAMKMPANMPPPPAASPAAQQPAMAH